MISINNGLSQYHTTKWVGRSHFDINHIKMMRNVNELVNDVEVSEPLKKLEVLIASVKYHLVLMFILM